jgi:3-oxoacyl-[acyl-carrier-protein] synthase II
VGYGFDMIRAGRVDMMLAGGADAFSRIPSMGFARLGAIAPERCQPFDKNRKGMVPGEGAAVLVLETLAHAQARGAQIYAELLGYGVSSDGYHVTAPDPVGDGAARSMTRALRRARVMPQQVDYINAHATGTPAGDVAETLAIKRVLGEYASTVAISATKSMIGHLTGAAGAVEAVATIMALKHGIIPPTINYAAPDPACDLDYVPNEPRNADIQVALSNSFGFGGQNATLVFSKYHERQISPAERAIEAEIDLRLDEQ